MRESDTSQGHWIYLGVNHHVDSDNSDLHSHEKITNFIIFMRVWVVGSAISFPFHLW